MPAGVIVAGGRSNRFGDREKAVAPLAGVPMIRHVADRVAPAVDRLVVNCRADQQSAIEAALSGCEVSATVAIDDEASEDLGPTAGIERGLRALDATEFAFVVGCDMPLVDPRFVTYLGERAAGRDGAVPKSGDGWYQTTHAVYRAGPMAAACRTALARGDRKVLAPLADLDFTTVSERDVREHAAIGADVFTNVNTEAELEAVATRFR